MKIIAICIDKGQLSYWFEIPFLGIIKMPRYLFKNKKKIGDMIEVNINDVELRDNAQS